MVVTSKTDYYTNMEVTANLMKQTILHGSYGQYFFYHIKTAHVYNAYLLLQQMQYTKAEYFCFSECDLLN